MTNNNGRSSLFLNEMLAYAVLMPAHTVPSFAIPLVRPDERANINYTPIINVHGRISGFTQIESKGQIINLRKSCWIELGQEEVFAVIDPKRYALVGTREFLIPKISGWIDKIDDKLVRLNFALFCNDEYLCHELGRKVFSIKLSELDDSEAAARWFVSSFVCLPIVQEVFKANSIQDEKTELSMADFIPAVEMLNSSTLAIIMPKSTPFDKLEGSKSYHGVVSRMLFFANAATGFTLTIGSRPASGKIPLTNKIAADLERIAAFSKQERRLAEVLKVYISNAKIESSFLDCYVDRSSYANKAITLAKENFEEQRYKKLARSNQVAEVLPQIIRAAFPRQRGLLILELARVLSIYNPISHVIRDFVSRSIQKEIVAVSEAIYEFTNKN